MTYTLLEQALDALEYHQSQTRPIYNTGLVIEAIRAHLVCQKRHLTREEDQVLRDAVAAGATMVAPGRLIESDCEPIDSDCAPNHICNGRLVHLPDGEQCGRCGSVRP